jgi:uncharacterized protein
MIDKDRPSSWVVFKKEYCDTCVANCCHMPLEVKIEDLVRLGLAEEDESPKKVATRLKQKRIVQSYRAKNGLFMIERNADSSCVFLKNSQCSVYENRPNVCREFPSTLGPRIGYCPYKRR